MALKTIHVVTNKKGTIQAARFESSTGEDATDAALLIGGFSDKDDLISFVIEIRGETTLDKYRFAHNEGEKLGKAKAILELSQRSKRKILEAEQNN